MKRNKDKDQYMKFIAVIDIIMKNSDERHPMTVNDIKDQMYELDHDFRIDYRAIKKYVYFYNEYYGDDIIESFKQGKYLYFYFVNRSLDMMEAKAIVDLVYSSDFFTLQTKKNYKKRIQDMFSLHYQSYFHKNLNLHVSKNENSQVFYKELEIITKAIQQKKKIRFCYQKPSLNNQNQNHITEIAPIDTVFCNNEYYLLCQGARNPNDCIQYRLDYVKNVEIIEDSSVYFNSFELMSFHEKLKNMTYMYGEGSIETIELDFKDYVYANMIDKFGKDIVPHKIDDHIYRVQVKHLINNTFYSWIIGFGGAIKISGNENQVQKFKDFLTSHFI